MKNSKRHAMLTILIVIWSLSCVTLLPGTTGEIPSTPTSETITLPTAIPASPTPSNQLSGKIVFNKGDDIYSINADGSNETRLATGELPTWSPDGNTIAFIANPDGDFEDDIFLMNSDGTNQRLLLQNQQEILVGPRDLNWQPNGSLLAFTALALKDRDNGYDLFTIDVNNAVPQKIPRRVADVWGTSWSPDGNQIIFVSVEDPNDTGTLYIVNADGTDEKKLFHIGYSVYPSFSPDGNSIILTAAYEYEIRIMNIDGSNQRPLTDKKSSYAVWSPDGKFLLVTITEEDTSRLYIINLDNNESTYLTDGYGGDWTP